jgi:lipoprotein-releasing system permease protein
LGEIKIYEKIFLLQGTLLSIIGGLMGLGLEIAIILLQQHYELIVTL